MLCGSWTRMTASCGVCTQKINRYIYFNAQKQKKYFFPQQPVKTNISRKFEIEICIISPMLLIITTIFSRLFLN